MIDQPNLFDIKGMVRRDDHATAIEAAARLLPKISELQSKILTAIRTLGPMTDEELELLPEFDRYGPSTIRKRRSELYQNGYLVEAGERLNRRGYMMTRWAIEKGPRQ